MFFLLQTEPAKVINFDKLLGVKTDINFMVPIPF